MYSCVTFLLQCILLCLLLQLFSKRSKVVNEWEMPFWEKLTPNYMTEESDIEMDGKKVVIRHPMPWRSEGMYRCIFKGLFVYIKYLT